MAYHVCAFVLGKLRTQVECPVIELFADDRGTEAIGGGLQGCHVVYGEEGVVIFAEADSGFGQFALDEGVTVEPICGMEGKVGGHAHEDGSQDFIPDVEVVMGEAAALVCEDAVVGVLGGILGHADAEGTTLLHAFEDEIDSIRAFLLHPAEGG